LSSNDSLLPVPANSVTVPAGATSTTFTALAGPVSTDQSVTLTATALNSVLLRWTASTSSNLSHYNVYRGVTSGGPYTLVRNVGLVTTYVDNNIQNGQNYYYVTTAVNSVGEESAYSNQAPAAVPSGVSQTAIVSLAAPPTVSSISPNSGSTAGGTAVTITGTNFASGATVTFGSTAATKVVVASSTSIIATSPAHSAGAATVTVTVNGQSGSLTNGFNYVAPPVITSGAIASGVVGVAFAYQITASNFPSLYGATGLPAGLTLNSATGLISGAPTAAGTSTILLSATNAGGSSTATFTLTVFAGHFVQATSKWAPGTTATSLSLTFTESTFPGDLIMVGFYFIQGIASMSVTDSQGNTFSQAGTQLVSPGGVGTRVYYAQNIKGGADTVTVTLSGPSYLEAYITEYAGLNQTSPIDGQAGAVGNAGAVSSGNLTTTGAGDVIYGFCFGDAACTAGTGFTARLTADGNLVEDDTVGNPGAYSAIGSATSGWAMQMVALKPASAH